MRVLITGSRSWQDWAPIVEHLIDLPDDTVVVHGACPSGADRIADRIAKGCGYDVDPHPADWRRHGKPAGFVRNAYMVDLGADVCFAFIRAGSPGSTMCARLAEKHGIPTTRVPDDNSLVLEGHLS